MPASNYAFRRSAVVGSPEGRPSQETRGLWKDTAEGMQGGDCHRVGIIQIGKYARQAPGCHGFARARRAEQQQVMSTCGCHFKGTTQLGLATDIPQVFYGRLEETGRAGRVNTG